MKLLTPGSLCLPYWMVFLVCFATWLSPGSALAQDDNAAAQAQEAFDNGMRFYENEDFEKAIAEFERGYQLQPATMFLYNIALSYLKLEDYPNAQTYADRVEMAGGLPARVHTANAGRLKGIDTRLSSGAIAEQLAAARAAEARAARAAMERTPEPATPPVPDEPAFGIMSYAGGGAILAGAGLIGGALYLGNDVDQRIEQLGAMERRDAYDAARQDIESDQTTAKILLFSGVGLAAAGTVLIALDILDLGQEEAPRVSILPQFGHTHGASALVRW